MKGKMTPTIIAIIITAISTAVVFVNLHHNSANITHPNNFSTSQQTTSLTTTIRPGNSSKVLCTQNDSKVSDPSAPHGLYVLYPYANYNNQQYKSAIERYLITNNSLVCGAVFFIRWADVDKGPNAFQQYNFSLIDNQIQPWINAGKIVNLDVWGVDYAAGTNGTTPQYVLNQINTVHCAGAKNQTLPIYWEPGYMDNYEQLIKAIVQHYQNNSAIGYIRFGIGVGGEDLPASNIGSQQCLQAFEQYNYSGGLWINYSRNIINYVASLKSRKQMMVSMNLLPANSKNTTTADAVAAAAVPLGIGLGTQGLQISDISNYNQNIPCSGNWCKNFGEYSGKVPLELQTLEASCVSNNCQTGSLNNLIPFAIGLHAQIFEIYWEDWLSAYDPNYTNYTPTYAATFEYAANVVGYSKV